ncbi:MAG: monooxygenase, partial [Gemmata sp.]
DSVVRDPATAEALKPWYRQFCKRPCFHDAYLQAFNRPNVTLVDTAGRGIDRVTPRGVVANGQEFELDCLVYATGFEVGTAYTRRAGYDLVGRGGITLNAKWAEGISTLHGMQSRGFPNCFFFGPQQAGFTVNFPHLLEEQSRHVAYIVRQALDRGARTVEVSEQAERDWVETIIRLSGLGRQFLEECTPGYYNNEGKPGERNGQDGFYGAGSVAFFRLLADWRERGDLAGLELS